VEQGLLEVTLLVEQAKEGTHIERLVLSTDSLEIAEIAKICRAEASFLRTQL